MPFENNEPLVLVPGLNCTQALFRGQIDAFGAGRAIVVADNRSDDSIAGMARRLLASFDGPFALAGLSMGGYVAMEAMRQAPERVTRLALLDTTARPDDGEAVARREKLIGFAEGGRFDDVHVFLWQKLVAPRHLADKDLEREVRGMMAETGAAAFVRQQRAIIGRADSRPTLPGIAVPTLVLVGEEDGITPPEVAREMAALVPGAELVVVPGAGHLTTMEDPQAVNAAMGRWLAA